MMHIEFHPFPPERGQKKIMVDGLFYGTLHMVPHGRHGSSYGFCQAGGGFVSRNGREVVVRGDVRERRLKPLSRRDEEIPSLEERLKTAVTSLVLEKLLIPETEYKVLARCRAEKRQAELEATKRRADVMLREEARRRLELAFGPGDEEELDVVVDLMKWAQSQ